MPAEFHDVITSVDQLRGVMPPPREAAIRKQISALDEHCRAFIARSPFLFMATANAAGQCDVSPKGDAPGFVQVLDDETVVIPDRPGNQRADSILNILENPHVGTIFVIPGIDWTLRVNGTATIVRDEDVRQRCAVDGKVPALAIAVHVEEAYTHCPKCIIRAKLWDASEHPLPEGLPSFARVARDHAGYSEVPLEAVEQAMAAANKKLY